MYEYEHGSRHGPWEEYDGEGKIYRRGIYEHGFLSGPWEEYYNNGRLFQRCECKNGVKHGSIERYSFNGDLTDKGTYVSGRKHGLWEYYYDGKIYYKGEHKNYNSIGLWYDLRYAKYKSTRQARKT